MVLNLTPSARWTRRDKVAQRRLASMMTLIIVSAAIFVVVVFPIKLAARFVGANCTYGSAFFAAFLQVILSFLTQGITDHNGISTIVGLVGGAIIYSSVLGITFLRGFAVSLISMAIVFIPLLIFAGVMLSALRSGVLE